MFKGREISDDKGNTQVIDDDLAQAIYEDMISNGYIKRGQLTDKYYEDKANNEIKVAEEVADSAPAVIEIIESIMMKKQFSPKMPVRIMLSLKSMTKARYARI